jgi:hypothetical protein
MDKICNKCNASKPLTEFNKNKNKADGYHVWCKKCISDNNKKLYTNNSEHKKKQVNSYYYENKNAILPKLKEYRNKPEIKAKQAAQEKAKQSAQEKDNPEKKYEKKVKGSEMEQDVKEQFGAN